MIWGRKVLLGGVRRGPLTGLRLRIEWERQPLHANRLVTRGPTKCSGHLPVGNTPNRKGLCRADRVEGWELPCKLLHVGSGVAHIGPNARFRRT